MTANFSVPEALSNDDYERRVKTAADWVARRLPPVPPTTGVILGSGLGALAKEIRDAVQLPYGEIPGFPVSTSPGHSGLLHFGFIESVPVLAMEGRFHLYEGYSMRDVTLPVRLMARLGVRDLIISSASGGLNPSFQKGDLLLIDDHINLLGDNPLRGPNLEAWGPRFPDMCAPYDAEMLGALVDIARARGVRAHPGVYAALLGPCLETRAEYRMLQRLGADAVGMSTVPEVIVGVHEGLRVAGISVITDLCLPDQLQPVSVAEILQVAAEAEPKLTEVVRRLIAHRNSKEGS
ncbi:MAG: purine-nucleoside phosphorylase [Planctomycetota bacterium]